MNYKAITVVTIFLLNSGKIQCQSSNIGDFVGQLTSLINQGGALGSALGSFPGGQGQLGPTGVNHQNSPGYQGQYPGGGGYGFPGGPPPPGGYPPPGGIPPNLGGGYGGFSPTSLYGALASIAQYDDLRCVPRLLCEVASGARPGTVHTASNSGGAGPLPFLSKDAIITLLTVLNFVDDSPLLVFGRAAVLGYTARGDPRQCLIAYPTCPRDPDKLVDYLNNHNGGFFRFFNQQISQYAPQYQQYQQPPYPPHPPQYPPGPPHPPQYPPGPPHPPQYPPGPPHPPQYPPGPPHPSRYPPGPPQYPPGGPAYPPTSQYQYPQQYYQRPLSPQAYQQRPGYRPYRKQPPYSQYYQQQQERIQNIPPGNEYDYFTSEGGTQKLTFTSNLETTKYYEDDKNNNYDQHKLTNQYYDKYNSNYYSNYNSADNYTSNNNYYDNLNSQNNKKLTFPTELPSSPAPSVIPLPSTSSSIPSYGSQDSTGSFSHRDVRKGKTLAFPSGERGESSSKYHEISKPSGPPSSSTMVFPDRTGTGDLRLDLDEYGGYKTVHFASETNENRPLVESTSGSIFRGQRDVFKIRFPIGRSINDENTITLHFEQGEQDIKTVP